MDEAAARASCSGSGRWRLFLADIYGDAEIVRDGVLPRRLITSCEHFHRAAAGLVPPNGVRIHVAGIDLVRDEEGVFRVLEDNLRNPSGVSYVMENRRTMARVFPDLFTRHRVRAVGDYPDAPAAGPAGRRRRRTRPTRPSSCSPPASSTPPTSSTRFLARQMGVELVEGRDLFCRDNVVYMRTTQGDQRVDVIYRRIDDDFLDPLQFRPDSVLGVAGLLNAARAGNVMIANAVGNGVADDKLVYTYVPDMIAYYLGEKPVLPNVDTFRCWLDEDAPTCWTSWTSWCSSRWTGSGGYGIVVGSKASARGAGRRRARRSAPTRAAGSPSRSVQLSTVPTQVDDRLVPRHVDLRPFAVNDGDKVWVLPGGLTRVALPEGSLVVNSSQGGGSKDTWVLAGTAGPPRVSVSWPREGAGRGRPRRTRRPPSWAPS